MYCQCVFLTAVLASSLLVQTVTIRADEVIFDYAQLIKNACEKIELVHPNHPSLNDDLSRKWLQAFLDHFDPRRIYFTRADHQEFAQFESRLDDMVKDGDISLAPLVRDRYRVRVNEMKAQFVELLLTNPDFSIDEKCSIPFDGYATTVEELHERWRLSLKFELLMEKRHGRSLKGVKTQISDRYHRIARQANEITDMRLYCDYLSELATCVDPKGGFRPSQSFRSFAYLTKNSAFSLGFDVRQQSGRFVITGMHPTRSDATDQSEFVGWCLLSIQKIDGNPIDLLEMHRDEFDELIRFPFGELDEEEELILELFNPVTLKRVTTSWVRARSDEVWVQ